jgi:hypothetical protein
MRSPWLLLLPAVVLLPGCLFTRSVWDWADEQVTVPGPTVSAITTWSRTDTESFRLQVRYSDGREAHVEVGNNTDCPAGLLHLARTAPLNVGAKSLVLAVQRGLARRGFERDPTLWHLARELDLVALSAAPLVTPTLDLGPLEGRSRGVWLTVDDGEPVPVGQLGALDDFEGQPDRQVVAVLVLPGTVLLDAATLPFQLVLAVVFFGLL